jgi:NDP-sugar pyrophosphorylase family protein
MNILILAAGLGTRLRPLTETTPKSLLRIGDESILHRLIRQCGSVFPDSTMFVNGSYLATQIASSLVSIPVLQRPYFIWETQPLGTAVTASLLNDAKPADLLVLHGDLVITTEGLQVFKNHLLSTNSSVLATHERQSNFARSVVSHKRNRVVSIIENTATDNSPDGETVRVNSGIYYFKSPHLSAIARPLPGENISPRLLNTVAAAGNLEIWDWMYQRVSVDSFESLESATFLAKSNS